MRERKTTAFTEAKDVDERASKRAMKLPRSFMDGLIGARLGSLQERVRWAGPYRIAAVSVEDPVHAMQLYASGRGRDEQQVAVG